MKKHFLQLVAICVSLAMVGCTTMQPLTVDPSKLSGALKRGDHVALVTAKGEQLQFVVENVDDSGLQGEGRRIAYSDIQSISRKEISAGRTALVVLGVVAAGALAAGGGGGGGGGGSSSY